MPGSQPEGGNQSQPTEGLNLTAALDTGQANAPNPGVTNDQGDNQGASPAPKDEAPAGETRESLLDVTRRALKELDDANAADGEGEGKGKAPDADADASAKAKDKPEAEGAADEKSDDEPLPFHNHPRWKEVQRERTELRGQVAELTPDANSFRAIQGFMAENDLSPDDVKQGFAIMAALRSDPAAAWELMKPYVDVVQAHMGQVLPDDLREKVESGLIDDDTAREVASLRQKTAFREQRAQRVQQRETAQRQEREATEATQATVNAVNQWFDGQQADPDFQSIAPYLEGEILRTQRLWAQQGKAFNTPEAAVAVSKEAYAAIRKRLAPTRQPVRTTPASSPAGSPNAGAAPRTMADAVMAALATG